MLCILRAMRYLPRGLECGNEPSGTTASHRVPRTAGGRGPGAAGRVRRPCGGRPGRDARHPRSDTRRPCALRRRGDRATSRCARAAACAGARRHGSGESRLRSGSAGRVGRLDGGIPEQRFGESPDLLVLRGQALPAAALPRQALPAAAVRSERSDHARLQHSRRHARVSAGHRCAVLRPHRCTGGLVGRCAARPLPGLDLAPATARKRSGPGARTHRRRRRPRRPPASPAEIAAARADRGPSAFVGLLRRTMPKLPHIRRLLRTRCRSAALITLLALTASGRAADWEMSLDTRLVSSDAGRSFMDGGLGTTRYGRQTSAIQLGRARFALTASLGELWSAHLDASAWDDKDRSPVGVTEAYLQYRPYPRAGYRFRLKAGAFYPPISLENRAAGWEPPYRQSYSAINTWLGVEVRTIGLEAQLDWLGTRTRHDFDLGVTRGAFGCNEGAGLVLAANGLMLHDRPTPVFGPVGPPGAGAFAFQAFDGRG